MDQTTLIVEQRCISAQNVVLLDVANQGVPIKNFLVADVFHVVVMEHQKAFN
jgi:hypothetical protein